MRDFLTGLAIILIVVLTTVLVAPYFVDWTSQRGFLEARLSHALGQKVTIGGNIDLKILPTPYLVLDQVVVGGDDGPVSIGIHHLDLELSVAPLLHGAFDIVEAQLEEPTIRVSLEHDRTLPTLPKAPAFEADVRFDRIRVSDGTLAIADPQSGRTFVFDHLDFDADAGSFTGPFKINGAEGPTDQRTRFHLATTTPDRNRARARLVVEETPLHAGLELDGLVLLTDAVKGTVRESFDGSLTVSGHLSKNADRQIAWKLSGPVKVDPGQATLEGGELRLGSDDAGVTLKANAKANLADQPELAFDLSAKQLDLDRLSGAPIDAVRPPPPKLPDIATLRRLLADAAPAVPTAIDLAIDNATYAGEALSALQLHIDPGLDDKAERPFKLVADGPGGSHLAVDGRLGTNPGPSFTGTVDVEADNLGRAVDWLGRVAPSLPWTGRDVPFRTVKLAGHVTADPDAIDGNALAITLDRSILSGTARLAFGTDARAAKVTADLRADALDLDALPRFTTNAGGSGNPFDLDLRLDAKAIKVSRLGDGALDAGHIQLVLDRTGDHIDLRDFRAENLGGAKIRARGRLDSAGGTLAMTLDAARLDAATALWRQLAPGPMADALVARAAALAPAKLDIEATLMPTGSALAPSRLSVKGNLGPTLIDVVTKPDTGQPDATSIAASLEAPDGAPLLSQFGLSALPMNIIGPSRVTLTATGRFGGPFDATLVATLGATTLDMAGRFDILSPTPAGSGTLRLESPNLTPLLQSLAVAFPDMTGHIPASITGSLTSSANETTLTDLKGSVGETSPTGTLRYRRAAGAPTLTGALQLDHLSLTSLLGLALGPPRVPAANATWSREPFAVGLIDPPRCSFALDAKTLEIAPGVAGTNARLGLEIAPNVVTLDKVTADLFGGRIDGGVTLRRDGRQATVEGQVALDRVAVHVGALDTKLTAKLNVAGGGASAAGLIASLAGSGAATAADLTIPGGDPAALPKVFLDVENDALSVDQDAVIRAFGDSATAPLSAGTRQFGLSLAAGILHFDPRTSDSGTSALSGDGRVSSKIDATFDLTGWRLEQNVEETLHALPDNWAGPPPTVVITLAGPLDKPARALDVSGFLNAVAARALARETARIEAYEFDIRERAIFNARLQSERRREEEIQKAADDARKAAAKAEADARKAEADRKARLEAIRQERLRRDQAAQAAREKAARDKARDEAEKAARDREPVPAPDPQQAPPPSTDPSALGRY